jgi:hypothetical protein
VNRRWAVCRVCGEGFALRTLKQDVCSLRCLCHDPRRRIGFRMKALQAARNHTQTRRAA